MRSAAFSRDSKRIVTASEDKTARLWDVETHKQVGELAHNQALLSAEFSPDGRHVVTASEDKAARLWDVPASTSELVEQAKASIPRCLTKEDRKAFFLPLEPPAWCIEMEKWPYETATWKQWLADTRAGKGPQLPSGR